MSNFPILDLVAGIIFLFFLLSIICSSIVEIILTVKKTRGKVLGAWIKGIFNKTAPGAAVSLGQEIIDHCAVTALSKAGQSPSYIDARNFVSALLEKVTKHSAVPIGTTLNIPNTIDDFKKAIADSPVLPTDLQRALLTYATEAEDTFASITQKTTGALELFRGKIENWYDTNMDRISGTLKQKYTRRYTMIAGIVTVLFLNADSIEIAKYLYANPEARNKLAAQAYQTGSDDSIRTKMEMLKHSHNAADSISATQLEETMKSKFEEINQAKAALNESIPLGWNRPNPAGGKMSYIQIAVSVLLKIVGLAVTVLAIMMGAPFWFDVLNKISNLRSSGAKPPSSTDPNGK
ncbi:MAG TPA: hypothetical protein VE978_27050 [Chitinophagales bacterium]|nr:hypothetical protein [Chitinophagales bacterium]